jgi:predicted kinase
MLRHPRFTAASTAISGRALRPVAGRWPGVRNEPAGPSSTELWFPPDSFVLVGGIPGAGKTTLLDRVERSSPEARLLDSHAQRAWLSRRLPRFVPYAAWRPLVHLLHYTAIVRALPGDRPLIVHECGTRAAVRRLLVHRARRVGRSAHLVMLDADLAAARQGQLARGRVVRQGPLRRHWARWRRLRARLSDPASAIAVLRREGWSSCAVLNRTEAGQVMGFKFRSGDAPETAATPSQLVKPVSRRRRGRSLHRTGLAVL